MGYTGNGRSPEMQRQRQIRPDHSAGLRESHVHDIAITREAPNYRPGHVKSCQPSAISLSPILR